MADQTYVLNVDPALRALANLDKAFKNIALMYNHINDKVKKSEVRINNEAKALDSMATSMGLLERSSQAMVSTMSKEEAIHLKYTNILTNELSTIKKITAAKNNTAVSVSPVAKSTDSKLVIDSYLKQQKAVAQIIALDKKRLTFGARLKTTTQLEAKSIDALTNALKAEGKVLSTAVTLSKKSNYVLKRSVNTIVKEEKAIRSLVTALEGKAKADSIASMATEREKKNTQEYTIRLAQEEQTQKRLKEIEAARIHNLARTTSGYRKVDSAQKRAVKSGNAYLKFWVRFLATQTAHRLVYAILNQVNEGIRAVAALQVKISEVRTISQSKQLPFDTWIKGVRKLSDAYGTTLEDVTEGAYQTLSNQVAKSVKVLQFMGSALKFARAAVTNTANSVQLLSSVLNSYHLNATQVTRISAIMFKTIELGSLRAKDLASNFGQVAVVGKQLGVGLVDLSSSVAVLTNLGVKPQKAMTQLRNIMLKLIKPTDAMKELIKSWGYETAQSAIKVLGFQGVLQQLNKSVANAEILKSGGGTELLGKLFGRVRAISGALGLLGKNMDKFNNTTKKFGTAQTDYLKAQSISIESMGKRLQIQANQVRNYFVQTVGTKVLTMIDIFTRKYGTLLEVTKQATTLFLKLAQAYVAYKVTLIAVSAIQSTISIVMARQNVLRKMSIVDLKALAIEYTRMGDSAMAANARVALSAKEATVALKLEKVASIGATAGLGLLVYAASIYAAKTAKNMAVIRARLDKITAATNGYTSERKKQYLAEIKELEKEKAAIEAKTKATLKAMGIARKDYLLKLKSKADSLADSIHKSAISIDDLLKTSASSFKHNIQLLDAMIKNFNNRIRKSQSVMNNIYSGIANESFQQQWLDSIGIVDKAYTKARKDMVISQAVGQPTGNSEIDNLRKRSDAFQAYRQKLASASKLAYSSGNIDEGRRKFKILLQYTDKLRQFGLSYNQISKLRNNILQVQVGLEKKITHDLQVKKIAADKVKKSNVKALKAIEDGRKALAKIKFDGSKFDVSAIKKKYEEVLKKVRKEVGKSMSPKVKEQLKVLLKDKVNAENTKSILKGLDDIVKHTLKTKDISTAIGSQLKDVKEYLRIIAKEKLIVKKTQTATKDVETAQQKVNKELNERIQSKQSIHKLGIEVSNLAHDTGLTFNDATRKEFSRLEKGDASKLTNKNITSLSNSMMPYFTKFSDQLVTGKDDYGHVIDKNDTLKKIDAILAFQKKLQDIRDLRDKTNKDTADLSIWQKKLKISSSVLKKYTDEMLKLTKKINESSKKKDKVDKKDIDTSKKKDTVTKKNIDTSKKKDTVTKKNIDTSKKKDTVTKKVDINKVIKSAIKYSEKNYNVAKYHDYKGIATKREEELLHRYTPEQRELKNKLADERITSKRYPKNISNISDNTNKPMAPPNVHVNVSLDGKKISKSVETRIEKGSKKGTNNIPVTTGSKRSKV